jgi:hypothetical protein
MIKTFWNTNAKQFDAMVNDAIKEGWTLKVRDVRQLANAGSGFYAELHKPDEVDDKQIGEALRVIKEACDSRHSCNDCPMEARLGICPCEASEPSSWMMDD